MNQRNNRYKAKQKTQTNTMKVCLQRSHVPEYVSLGQIYPHSLFHAHEGASATFLTRKFQCFQMTFKYLNAITNLQLGLLSLSKSQSQLFNFLHISLPIFTIFNHLVPFLSCYFTQKQRKEHNKSKALKDSEPQLRTQLSGKEVKAHFTKPLLPNFIESKYDPGPKPV